jgi:hypothetical protein
MTSATSELMVEKILRAALSQMGSSVGCAEGPLTGGKQLPTIDATRLLMLSAS